MVFQNIEFFKGFLVQTGFAGGASFPAAVDPEPLVGVAADPIFCGGGALLGGGLDVGFGVIGALELNLGAEMEDVFFFIRFPEHESGEYGCACFESYAGQAGGGAGFATKELDKNPLGRGHVGIHEDADGFAGAHGGEQAASEVIFMEDAVAVEASDAVHKVIEAAVVEAADDHAHGVAHEGVVEAGELPRAEVAGDYEHAFAAGFGGEIVVEAFSANPAAGVGGGVAGHAAELDQLPAEMAVDAFEEFCSFSGRDIGECQFQIALANSAQAAEGGVDQEGKGAGEKARKAARQQAQGAGDCCHQAELQAFTNWISPHDGRQLTV